MRAYRLHNSKLGLRRVLVLTQSLVLLGASILPFMAGDRVSALQLTDRSATVSTAAPSASGVDLSLGFTIPAGGATAIQTITLEFCNEPLGTCTTTNAPTVTGATYTSQSGFTQSGNFSTVVVENGFNGGTNNQIRLSRTQATSENPGAFTLVLDGITNNATANRTYYIRIRLYSQVTGSVNSGTTPVHDGTVAQSTSQTLTVNARVQEQLTFCTGTTTTNAIGTTGVSPILNSSSATVSDCSNADGTAVNLGTINSSAVSVSPVATASGGSNTNAYAMISTNAQNGATVAYRAVQDGATGGRLKIDDATCSGSTAFDSGSGTTDQCFGSSTTQTAFTAGSEAFGMTIGGVSCTAVVSTAYTCDYTGGNVNLRPQSGYIGATFTAGSTGSYGTSTGFAWRQDGTAVTIASSAASAIRVISFETLLLRFAATSAVTTPTGQYTTQADFIATPTF